MDARPGSFSILVVCDGNVCRSPAAQYAIATRLPGARVESAGARATTGARLCTVVASSLDRDDSAERFAAEFRSRRLQDVDLAGFDLVLTATANIRADLTRLHPALRDRFFTLREAADVLAAAIAAGSRTNPLDMPDLIATMNGYRGAGSTTSALGPLVRDRSLGPLDIPDAHGERKKRHQAVIDLSLSSAASVGDSLSRIAVD